MILDENRADSDVARIGHPSSKSVEYLVDDPRPPVESSGAAEWLGECVTAFRSIGEVSHWAVSDVLESVSIQCQASSLRVLLIEGRQRSPHVNRVVVNGPNSRGENDALSSWLNQRNSGIEYADRVESVLKDVQDKHAAKGRCWPKYSQVLGLLEVGDKIYGGCFLNIRSEVAQAGGLNDLAASIPAVTNTKLKDRPLKEGHYPLDPGYVVASHLRRDLAMVLVEALMAGVPGSHVE